METIDKVEVVYLLFYGFHIFFFNTAPWLWPRYGGNQSFRFSKGILKVFLGNTTDPS